MTDSHGNFLAILKRHKYVALFSAMALAAFFLWPTTTAQCPMWEVWVVDETGQPLEGMTVRLTFQNYSAESDSHSVDVSTDARGYVVFKSQNLSVPRIQRIVTTMQAAMAGVHASFGPHAWVWTFGNGLEGVAVSDGHVTDWNGAPPRIASKIVAKHGEAVIRTK
jgi:hypothetical protein